MNLLFVCSRNQWRSPTAENVYRNDPRVNVRSAGTSASARKQVSASDLSWADLICVMESKHKRRLCSEYPEVLEGKTIHVLEIEDNYRLMDPELVEILLETVEPVLA